MKLDESSEWTVPIPFEEKSKHALFIRKYRKKEERQDKYKLQRQIECERLREFRRNMSDDTRERYKEGSKLRMRRFRQRKREESAKASQQKGNEWEVSEIYFIQFFEPILVKVKNIKCILHLT